MKLLLIDNYDSFTWNLHQLLMRAGSGDIVVVKNDRVLDSQLRTADAIVFSPGPGLPEAAGRMKEKIAEFAGRKKMLGICLGHQAIAEVFCATLIQADEIFHGTATKLITRENHYLFDGINEDTSVGRYHSWVVSNVDFPEDLIITAVDEKNTIMAIRHRMFDISGVQFHPESILTPAGERMMRNWMRE